MAESTTTVDETAPGNRLLEQVGRRTHSSQLTAHSSPLAFDTVLALGLAAGLLAEQVAEGSDLAPQALILALPLVWRRSYPIPAFGAVLLGAILAATTAQYVAFYCIMVAAYSVGAYSTYRVLAFGVFLATAIGIDSVYGGALPNLPNAAGPFLVLIPFWLIGMAMRTRQLRADALEDRASRLEREGEQATQLALAQERSRIARELHDVVAHSVSVMVVQAGAARQVLTSSPDEARGALLAVEASGREAMAELRTLLGLLHEDGADVDLTPQPGIEQLDMLVQRVQDAGLPVKLRVEGVPQPLPTGLDLAAYRIAQEALTNCLKYSGLARTEVVLHYREAELELEILDDGPGIDASTGVPNTGRGLIGMRERVAMYGGRLEAGPRLERGYAVRAWLPLTEAAA